MAQPCSHLRALARGPGRPPPPVGGAPSGPDPRAAGIAGGRAGGATAPAGSCGMSHPSPVARPSKASNPRAFFDVDIGGERGGEGARRNPGEPPGPGRCAAARGPARVQERRERLRAGPGRCV